MAGAGGDTGLGGGALTPGGGKLVNVGMAEGMGVGVMVGPMVGFLAGVGVGVGFGVGVEGVGVGALRSVHVERALLTLRAEHRPRQRLPLRGFRTWCKCST